MFFINEIDIIAVRALIKSHRTKDTRRILVEYCSDNTSYFMRFPFHLFSNSLHCFSAQYEQKTLSSRRGSSYRPGMECVFPIIYSLTLRWPGSATAVPAADRQVPLPAGLPQGSAPGLHGTAGPLQTPLLRPVRSRYARRSRGRYRAAGHQG